MPFASTTYNPDSVVSQVSQAGPGGIGMEGFADLLRATAARRAFEKDRAFKAEQDRIAWEERQAEQGRRDDMAQREIAMKRADYQAERQDERALQGETGGSGQRPQHWFKDFGIGKGGDFGGPIEVAPGTFGAYKADIGDMPGVAAAAAQRGLTPGMAGQRLGGTDRLLGEVQPEQNPARLEAAQTAADEQERAASAGRAGWGNYDPERVIRGRGLPALPRRNIDDYRGGWS